MLQTEFRAMGSRINIFLDADTTEAAKVVNQVIDSFEEWEQSLSRFRESSELNMVNRSAGARVRVSDPFWKVLQIALEMKIISEGLVTPMVLGGLETIGYDRSFAAGVPEAVFRTENQYFTEADMTEIQLFPESREIRLPEGMRLDFGGTAKGWAAHQAMLRLAEFGPVLVNAGGDISISGLQANGAPWEVGIIDPLQPAMDLVRLTVGRSGVATSGKDYHKWLQDGVLRHHIIDPRTGLSAETDILSASVCAPTVVDAEMAAKVIFILGSQDGADWLLNHPQFGALLVLDDGVVLTSQFKNGILGG